MKICQERMLTVCFSLQIVNDAMWQLISDVSPVGLLTTLAPLHCPLGSSGHDVPFSICQCPMYHVL